MAIRKVGVVGCGLMGSGIAQTCAASGYDVVIAEVSQELLDKGMDRLRGFLADGVKRGKMTQEQVDAILSRIKPTVSLKDFADRDLIVEAIIENMAEKRKLYAELDKICPPHTIFASNTSSLTIIEMAAATKRLDRFIGLHFFNPVPLMKLVEVVKTICSSDEVIQEARAFAESLGKKPVLAKDTPGFIVNLLLVPYLLDAVRVYENGLASREDIDTAMVLGCGYPMGPLTLLDLVGLDTTYYIANILFEEFKEPKYAAPPLMKRMVLAGQLGRKSGKGFYDYTEKK
ncbi:MAG: 3-hydroxybutyryl-CoA dehydrogenase [Chloroflexi bacterium]|nr:3-hydroxybutyryl-CoA dehydrogenase [Chloroflexota bacterium]MDA8188661.1 3-hydroxybutyryl-CoA dehydrogenase [Dehalococcoidales bacterium]